MPADGADRAGSAARAARTIGAVVVAVVVVIAGLYWLGATHPPRSSGVATDSLGPDSGEPVADYVASSQRGLARATGVRWALVSLRTAVDDATARSVIAGTTPAQVALHVPIPDVATPTAVVPVTPDAGSFTTARELAVSRLDTDGGPVDADRGTAVDEVVTQRLRASCACVAGVVVRGTAERLRTIATDPRVRVVQVLPADAGGGRFAVVPLLPEQTVGAAPLPDTGAVPAR
ncbi:hypothetical protein [uncultured Williamsia sp.]|uniref:hypothetical protein n=1 Tax=uncultured Williamsia sp. TaxID=259311 RepID=UPI002605A15B|nr:hypothetical protein [uncultured Williamsia sp.]